MKVSVIVPVYNVEKYLRKCVDSLLNQTLKEAEFIFVDDGSTDSSLEILKEYQAKDDRVQIYTQQNQFAGVARNNGFAHATGKYVIFLDSDDFFDASLLKTCYDAAEKYQTDVVMFGYDTIDCETNKITATCINAKLQFEKQVFSAVDLGSEMFIKTKPVPWDKFVRRSFLQQQNISFMDSRKCNDAYWARMVVLTAKRMVHLRKVLVHYRSNNSASLMGSVNKYNDCYLKYILAIKEGMIRLGIFSDEMYKRVYLYQVERTLSLPFNRITDISALEEFYRQAKEMLIPQILENEAEIQPLDKTSKSYAVVNSQTFEEFIIMFYFVIRDEFNQLQAVSVPKQSITFRVGSIILYIPLKIRDFLKSIR